MYCSQCGGYVEFKQKKDIFIKNGFRENRPIYAYIFVIIWT